MTKTLNRDGHQVLDFDEYVPHLISVIANRVSAISSQEYLARFGLGTVEMRIVASLAYRPGSKAAEICELVRIDKGAASRGFSRLDKAGFLTYPTDESGGRQKRWRLSDKGYALHDEFLEMVIRRESLMLEGLSSTAIKEFKQTLHHIIGNISRLEGALETEDGPALSIATART